jgi:anti-anti-sigma factor
VETYRDGGIDVVRLLGEHDLSTVDALDEAIREALSDETTRLLLDLSDAEFIDSSIVRALIRWSNETQVSEREALAIAVGAAESRIARTLALVRVIDRLPVFETPTAAREALLEGSKPRTSRPFGWLTDRQLEGKRIETLAELQSSTTDQARDDASSRLDHIVQEQKRRADRGA